ncbi:hypothetical protein FXO38_07116 [Capsicum annuum]|nr:hypothetical protein FXO38_07116 [Capsicum annuum]
MDEKAKPGVGEEEERKGEHGEGNENAEENGKRKRKRENGKRKRKRELKRMSYRTQKKDYEDWLKIEKADAEEKKKNTRKLEGIEKRNIDVKFSDVAGLGKIREELEEIGIFFTHGKIYRRRGVKIPGGILLCGPLGVGKTLLAKAVAGEAGTIAELWTTQGWNFNFRRQPNDWEVMRVEKFLNMLGNFKVLRVEKDVQWWKGGSKGIFKVGAAYRLMDQPNLPNTTWAWKQI